MGGWEHKEMEPQSLSRAGVCSRRAQSLSGAAKQLHVAGELPCSRAECGGPPVQGGLATSGHRGARNGFRRRSSGVRCAIYRNHHGNSTKDNNKVTARLVWDEFISSFRKP